jgi:DNA-binding SARP family transcriptional activator/TolB-like protein
VIRLHLFGAVRLEGNRPSEHRSLLSQPRRVALLAYLALRARHGAERRDRLLGVFWPESDTDHARGALRSALHYLRASLGAEVVRSRGSEEVQIDLDLLWCDAVEFEQRCDAGDVSGALRLYQGDLLEGFFISEAPEFEHWLAAERSRLHRRAVEAARALASEAAAGGGVGLAIVRLRQLLDLAPTDEEAARDLMRHLAAADDRGEALRVFRDLEVRLDEEYSIEPAEETRRLAEAICAGTPPAAVSRPADPAPEPAGGALTEPPSVADMPDPADAVAKGAPPSAPEGSVGVKARPQLPGWVRQRAGLGAAIAGVLLLTAAAAFLVPGRGDAERPSRDIVAVLPFAYRGAAAHAYLAEGLADLLSANLDGAGELRSVDPRALLSGVDSGGFPIHPTAARRTASAHGAGLFVLGSVTEASGRVRIAAALYGPGLGAARVTAEVVVEGGADDVLSLVDRLTVGLLEGRGTTPLGQAALRTTESLEALKFFLRGEAALRRMSTHEAADHYRRATELDSTFALAHYRLSSTGYRMGVGRPGEVAIRALRHAPRLAREDSLLVAGWHHHVFGNPAQAYGFYRDALMLRPSHVEAEFQLGELFFHWGSAIGSPASEARAHFERVLDMEPKNVEAMLHLVRLAARDGRPRDVAALAERMRSADAAGIWEVEVEVLRAFLSPDPARQDRALGAAVSRSVHDRALLVSMAAYSYNLADVERAAAARLSLDLPPVEEARLQLFLAQVRLARGRYRDADRGVVVASVIPPARRLEYRAMMATLPFLPLPPDTLRSVRAEIASHPDLALAAAGGPIAGTGNEYPHILWPGMFRVRRLYLLGALHARLGEEAQVRAVGDSIARYHAVEPFADRYTRLVRAQAAAGAGRPAVALGELGAPQPPPLRMHESLFDHGRVYERWLRAELLRESGRLGEALRWYGTFPDPAGRDLPYVAPSHLRRAEIHDSAGDPLQAAYHYGRFVELWADADAELQPLVGRARERLRELTGK